MTTSSLTFYTPRTLKQFNTKLHRALIALNELTTNKQKGGEGVSFLMTLCLTIILLFQESYRESWQKKQVSSTNNHSS